MGPPQPGGQLQHAVTTASNILWSIYRTYFSGVVAQLVPAHTRDAAFQLFCDLRANTPKDQKFVARHVKAFVPHSSTGWLALASGLSYALAAAAGLGCMLLGLSVAGIYTSMALAVVGGMTLSFVLSVLAIGMAVTACCSGAFAFGALLSYAGLSSALAVARFLLYLVSPAAPAATRAGGQALTPSTEPQQQQAQQGQQGPRLISPPPARLKELASAVPTVMASSAAVAKPQGQGQGRPLPTDSAGSAAGGAAGVVAPSVKEAEEPSPPGPELAPALPQAPVTAAAVSPAAAEAAPAVAVEDGEGMSLPDGLAAAAAREQASMEQDAAEWAAAVAAGLQAGASKEEEAAPAEAEAGAGATAGPGQSSLSTATQAAGDPQGKEGAEEPFVLKSRAGRGGGLRVSVNGITTPPTEPEELEREGDGVGDGDGGGKQDSAAELSYSRPSSGKERPRDGTPRADEAAAAAAKQRWMWEGSPGRWSPEKMHHQNFPSTPSGLKPQDGSIQPAGAREA